MELCRVTEAAALAAARWMGRGNKNALDQAAVNAMRDRLKVIQMDGVVVIGEGEKDEAPMLYIGERIGNGQRPEVDVAVDPVDGTTLLSKGLPNAVAVIALAERGAMYYPPGIVYMDKLAVGPAGRGVCSLEQSVEDNIAALARSKGEHVDDLTIVVLDRPRHAELIERVRATGHGLNSSQTATWQAASCPPCPTPVSTCCSASAARRRRSSPRLHSSAWAAISSASSGRATRRSVTRPSGSGSASTRC